MKFLFSLAFCLTFIGCAVTPNVQNGVTISNIQGAQQIIGLNYSDPELDSMQDYLNRNLKGYKDRMNYTLKNSTSMALYFDPRPAGFEFQPSGISTTWQADSTTLYPENESDLAFYTIPQLAGLLRSGKISSVDLTQFFIHRLKTYSDTLSCLITLTEARALQEAKQADEELAAGIDRGILHGIPYGIKDLFSSSGDKTTWGAAPYKDQTFDFDATVIQKLQKAGAILVAKLTSGALASGDVWFGGKTLNPWNLKEGSSGSSAGSASATSAGLVPFAIGTETWGSILSPSNRCGVTGLRPTFGRVSRYGCMTLSWTMDKVGPICRNSRDCAIVFSILNGKDELDKSTTDYAFNYSIPVKQIKIAYLKEMRSEKNGNHKNDSLTLNFYQQAGFELAEISLPNNLPIQSLTTIIRAETGAVFDELALTNTDDLMVRQDKWARPNTIRQAHFIPAVEYIQANRFRVLLMEEMNKLFDQYDVIICPSSGTEESLITNLTGHPSITVPNGFKETGSPTGFTIIGGLYKENAILQVANLFQEATDFDELHPPLFK